MHCKMCKEDVPHEEETHTELCVNCTEVRINILTFAAAEVEAEMSRYFHS